SLLPNPFSGSGAICRSRGPNAPGADDRCIDCDEAGPRIMSVASVSILGVPNDDNSSFLRGASEAPPKIREELWSDANNTWTETGVDLSQKGVLRDYGDLSFDGLRD